MSYENAAIKLSATVAVPLIALGGTTNVAVSCPGAKFGQVVHVNVDGSDAAAVTLLGLLSSSPEAYVSAADVVTLRLRSGIAVSAGNRKFLFRVFN